MLHFHPELVRMNKAKNFLSNALLVEQEFTHLRATGPHGFGWIAQDLNSDGALGDASSATAKKGEETAIHQVKGFIALLRDMTVFSLDRLNHSDANALR
jgi:creatinine amidohydrolase